MKVIVKEPGRQAQVQYIVNKLKFYQKIKVIVDGDIEVVHIGDNIRLICNKEGNIKELQPNLQFGFDLLAGNVIAVGDDGEGFRGLSDDEVPLVLLWMELFKI